MALDDAANLFYEDNVKNRQKRRAVIIICECLRDRDGRLPVKDIVAKFKETFGDKTYSSVLYYQVIKRMKLLGFVRIKQERDIETQKKRRMVEFIPDTFEFFIKNNVLRGCKK